MNTQDLQKRYRYLWQGEITVAQCTYYYYQLMHDGQYDVAYLRQKRQLRPGSIGKALAQTTAAPAPTARRNRQN